LLELNKLEKKSYQTEASTAGQEECAQLHEILGAIEEKLL
jgi:hypothetical protein